MSSKKIIKRYLIGLLGLIVFGLVISAILSSDLLDYFRLAFFEEGKIITTDAHYIVGRFKVTSFLRFLVLFVFVAYTLIFADIAYWQNAAERKEKAQRMIALQQRVKDILNEKNVTPVDEYLELDNVLSSFLSEKERYKTEYEQNMTKLNLSMAFLAHDLRTPLTSILGYTDLLLNNEHLGKEYERKYIGVVRNKSFDLEKLIDQFFVYTKTQLQTEKLVKTETDLYKLLVQVKETFYPYLGDKKLDILMEIPEKCLVLADPNALARCFNNILKNAILYSKDHGKINISYEEAVEDHIITFENQINPNQDVDIENIFQPFYRGDYSRNHEIKGSGLGLNIAKTIAEAHQGEISAQLLKDTISIKVKLPKFN